MYQSLIEVPVNLRYNSKLLPSESLVPEIHGKYQSVLLMTCQLPVNYLHEWKEKYFLVIPFCLES